MVLPSAGIPGVQYPPTSPTSPPDLYSAFNFKPFAPTADAAASYPTPPPSPDLDDSLFPLDASPETARQLVALFQYRVEPNSHKSSHLDTPSLTRLATVDDLPPSDLRPTLKHRPSLTNALRAAASVNLFAAFGRTRCLGLDEFQSAWPYASTSDARMSGLADEDAVDAIIGDSMPETRMDGVRWHPPRHKVYDHISTIFVHPPTPEHVLPSTTKESSQTTPFRKSASITRGSRRNSPSPLRPQPQTETSTLTASTSGPVVPAPRGPTIPLQVLPEVRSPPRRSLATVADSLQITHRRGRRPRLFGFTEMMPESNSSSANSSAVNSPAGSRTSSPDRGSTRAEPSSEHSPPKHVDLPATSSEPQPDTASHSFIPRRHPVRARSEASLPTVSSSAASAAHMPPRRRDNGLKLDFTGIVPVMSSPETQTSVVPSPYSAKLIRKKSGEILKPALKYGGPLGPHGTPLAPTSKDLPAEDEEEEEEEEEDHEQEEEESRPRPRWTSKSLPATPSCPKYVHFDSQLERVKLFLHDQKPQVVSRTGSPTLEYTTSEGEEYPFPSTDDEKDERRVLNIKLPNFPTSHTPDVDLYLESLFLDDDRKSLKGVVLCKNLAFQKWVAIRFTFDWWQTTSEVTATHKESVKGGGYDRFGFIIKLHDILNKIEEKTLFLAIRYNAAGREIWDANDGQNYQVLFEKVAAVKIAPKAARQGNSIIQPGMGKAVGGKMSQWSVNGSKDDDRMADLRARLSSLSAGDERTSPPQLSPLRDRALSFTSPRKSNGFGSPQGSPRRNYANIDTSRSDLPSAGPALAARYDFGSAFKMVRRNSNSPSGRCQDLPQVRTGLLVYGPQGTNGHAATEFYSPRFSPSTLPDPLPVPSSNDLFFGPHTVSPLSMSSSTNPSPLAVPSDQVPSHTPVPDVKVHGPSPEPAEDVMVAISSTLSSMERAITSPAVLAPSHTTRIPTAKSSSEKVQPKTRPSPISHSPPTSTPGPFASTPVRYSSAASSPLPLSDSSTDSTSSSPPTLESSGSRSQTPSESPQSPADLSLPRWSPTRRSVGQSQDLTNYSSFIERFCWGGNPSPLMEKRSHSSSDLDTYFASPPSHSGRTTPKPLVSTASNAEVHPSSLGLATPICDHRQDRPEVSISTTPSSSRSYYSSCSTTPTTREDMAAVDEGLRGLESPCEREGGMGRIRSPGMTPSVC